MNFKPFHRSDTATPWPFKDPANLVIVVYGVGIVCFIALITTVKNESGLEAIISIEGACVFFVTLVLIYQKTGGLDNTLDFKKELGEYLLYCLLLVSALIVMIFVQIPEEAKRIPI
jgi:Ca2+/Na+ antiporter